MLNMMPSALHEAQQHIRFDRAQRKHKRTGPSDPELLLTPEILLYVSVFYPVTLQCEVFQ